MNYDDAHLHTMHLGARDVAASPSESSALKCASLRGLACEPGFAVSYRSQNILALPVKQNMAE